MKFISIQTGARRGYAVPLILQRAGLLDRFYTDVAGNCGFGKWLVAARWLPLIGSKFDRLANRKIPCEILSKTKTFGFVFLKNSLRVAFGSKDVASQYKIAHNAGERFGKAMIREGFGGATHLFSMLSEAGPMLKAAKDQGIIVVAEIYILLSTERILLEEQTAFPDWVAEPIDYAALRHRFIKNEPLIDHSQFYICPSSVVQDDLVESWGVSRNQTAMVPYGLNSKWLLLEPKPQKGRVLFVGTADLRKGIHYLAMAAEMLHAQGLHYEFRVAGNVTSQVSEQPLCRHLTFLGRVPRHQIQEEYQKADVFVLPSLAEGSAEVTYEALAARLPLIVTPAAGSVGRDGIEGKIVPERDPTSLANALATIIENRDLRESLAQAARERAREFTWERYGERLVAALKNFPQ